MKRKIKYTPEITFSVLKDGFFGEFYRARGDKCMIAFGGSQGLFLLCKWLAEKFVAASINVMIIAYHGEKGLPKYLHNQPVDSIISARYYGFEKIGLWGISMGGTLALLAGSLRPDLFQWHLWK